MVSVSCLKVNKLKMEVRGLHVSVQGHLQQADKHHTATYSLQQHVQENQKDICLFNKPSSMNKLRKELIQNFLSAGSHSHISRNT